LQLEHRRSHLALGLILALAAGMRLYGLARHGLWQDEWTAVMNAVGLVGTSYNNTLLPPAAQDAVLLQRHDLFPADFWAFDGVRDLTLAGIREDSGNGWLHKVILHFWMDFAGVRDASLRAPSATFGVIAVLLTFLLARALEVPHLASLISAALVALHPLLIRSSQEVRGYTLATALSLLASLLIVRIVRRPPRKMTWYWASYVACASLSFLCHYLTVSIVVAHAAYLAVHRPPRRVIMGAAVAGLGLAAVVAVWYLAMGREGLAVALLLSRDFTGRAELAAGGTYALPASPRYLAAGFTQLALAQYGNQLQETGMRLRVLAPFLLIPGALTAVALRAFRGKGHLSAGWFLAACSAAYPLLAFGASILQGNNILFTTRYAQFGVPYTAILLAVAVAEARPHPLWRTLVAGLAAGHAIVVLMSLAPAYEGRIGGVRAPPRVPNGHAAAAALIAASYRAGDIVLVQDLVDAKRLNLYWRREAVQQRIEATLPEHELRLVRGGEAALTVALR
jgi:hypothetical protein